MTQDKDGKNGGFYESWQLHQHHSRVEDLLQTQFREKDDTYYKLKELTVERGPLWEPIWNNKAQMWTCTALQVKSYMIIGGAFLVIAAAFGFGFLGYMAIFT